MARVLIPLPARDFDPTEVAIPWRILSSAGHEVVFATPGGRVSEADPRMLSGEGLDAWSFVPFLRRLKALGLLLRADAAVREAYRQLALDPNYLQPLPYARLAFERIDAMLLPGGHWSRGMRDFLESEALQGTVARAFEAGKPIAAVCHGVLLVARSRSPQTGRSVLHGRKTTGLTWKLERSAWNLMKYAGRFWDPDYYRTYVEAATEPSGFRSVQAEVERALARPEDFLDVPRSAQHHFRKSSGLFRDSATDSSPAFVVADGNYLSARWPGDVHTFAARFCEMIR